MTKTEKYVERQNLIDILDRNFGYTDDEPAHVVADRLIAKGYRKQSDTVKEFASKVKLYLEEVSVCGYIESAKLWQLCADISDLAEKYGKENE